LSRSYMLQEEALIRGWRYSTSNEWGWINSIILLLEPDRGSSDRNAMWTPAFHATS